MDGMARWLFPGACALTAGLMIPGKMLGCIAAIAVYALVWQVNEDCLKMIEEDE